MTEEPDTSVDRLQKIMARAGIASRRVCEQMIFEGRVSLNGEEATLGDRASLEDRIEIDGIPLLRDPSLVHYLLHKPAGVVSTADDPQGRPTVVSLVPHDRRVFPVGRLDTDSEGLIVLTNNGELTHLLTHPSFGVAKEYLAHVEGTPNRAALKKLRDGVELDDGVTAPAEAAVPQDGMLKLTIHEGRNRQIRRMCEAVGHPVIRLVRIRIGTIVDPKLAAGQWRDLKPDEVRALYASVTR